jgi:4a-hydroxytetrahydrobiopterin dehydratase
MPDLAFEHCENINSSTRALDEADSAAFFTTHNGWINYSKDGEPRIEKTYTFKNFKQAMEFTNGIAQLAEEENHHPSILTEYGKVTLGWWTHKIKGLHRNDLIMAAKSDALFTKST